jgi:hypothetical protein
MSRWRCGRRGCGSLHEARLHAHVRREERQLFPLIESTLDDRALRALAARLAG